jgi:hypothetical protein
MKQINQTTYHSVNVNRFDVDQIRVTYCKTSKQYHVEQVDRLGRVTRDEWACDTYGDMKQIVRLLTEYLNKATPYPYQVAVVN